jgi:6-methylsalicylate decarboxylase
MTNTGGLYLGNERLDPVFAELERREAVVFLHPTAPVCWEQSALGRPSPMVEFIFDTARTVTDLVFSGMLARHPGLPVIVPHSGGALPVMADRIDGFMRHFPSAIGTGAVDAVTQLSRLYYDTAGSAFPRQVPALLNLVEPGQLLYGSDYCWTPAPSAQEHTSSFDSAAGPVEGVSWRALTTANARRILPRLGR